MAKLSANSAFSDPKLHSLDHFPVSSSGFFSSVGKECTLIQVWKAREGGFFRFTFFSRFCHCFFFSLLCNSQLTFAFSYFIDLSHGVLWSPGLSRARQGRHHQPAPRKAFPSRLIYSQVLVFWSYASRILEGLLATSLPTEICYWDPQASVWAVTSWESQVLGRPGDPRQAAT